MGALAVEELAALVEVEAATLDELREALARMPTYQRAALRWLARELELARAPTPAAQVGCPAALELEQRKQRAALERARLERMIATSGATPEEKAFMQQTLAHLWRAQLETRDTPCPTAPRLTSR